MRDSVERTLSVGELQFIITLLSGKYQQLALAIKTILDVDRPFVVQKHRVIELIANHDEFLTSVREYYDTIDNLAALLVKIISLCKWYKYQLFKI